MPLPTLKQLLERVSDGFYGFFAANWSEMDYKSGGNVGGKGYNESTRPAPKRWWRPRKLRRFSELLTVATGSGPRSSVDRAPSMKSSSQFGPFSSKSGLWGTLLILRELFCAISFLFFLASNPRILFQARKGLSGLASCRSGPGRRTK